MNYSIIRIFNRKILLDKYIMYTSLLYNEHLKKGVGCYALASETGVSINTVYKYKRIVENSYLPSWIKEYQK